MGARLPNAASRDEPLSSKNGRRPAAWPAQAGRTTNDSCEEKERAGVKHTRARGQEGSVAHREVVPQGLVLPLIFYATIQQQRTPPRSVTCVDLPGMVYLPRIQITATLSDHSLTILQRLHPMLDRASGFQRPLARPGWAATHRRAQLFRQQPQRLLKSD